MEKRECVHSGENIDDCKKLNYDKNDSNVKNNCENYVTIECTEEVTKLKQLLSTLEIPFNWKLSQVGVLGENVIERLEEKDEEICDPLDFKFRNFIIQLLLAYEYFNSSENLNECEKTKTRLLALQKLKDCEILLNQHKHNDCTEPIFIVTYKTLLNITIGCKAFIMMQCELISESKEEVNRLELQLHTKKPSSQRAADYGVKSYLLMEYGNDNFPAALECASIARQLDPSIGEWHFLVGNLMARIRRVNQFMNFPQEDEIISLKKAVEICGYPRYLLHLAQTYREEGFRIFNTIRYDIKKNLVKANEVDELNKKSFEMYRKLIEENSKNSRILARCAFGITKLPVKFRDVELAVKTIENALELAPNNPMINHYTAIIYERFANKIEEAEKYYKIAIDLCVFGACMDFVRLKFSQNPNEYNPVPFLTEVANKFLERDRYCQTISQIASYYFFHKNDIQEAWKYIEKIAATNPKHSSLRTHKSNVLRMNDPCDLCDVVFDEIKLKIAQKKYESDTEKEELMEIGCRLRTLCPDSHRYFYNHLKNKILDKSRELREGKNKNNRKRKTFSNKGKGLKNKSNQRANPNFIKSGNNRGTSRSTDGRKNSNGRSFNRSVSKDTSARASETNQVGKLLSHNRDRSKSTSNRKFSQKRTGSNSRKSLSSSLENIPSDMKFSDNLLNKWQGGLEGVNTGLDLQWYGPHFKPFSRFSENLSSRKFSGSQESSLNNSPYYKQSNNSFRSNSLDRFGQDSYFKHQNSRLEDCKRPTNCENNANYLSYPKKQSSNKSAYSFSCENIAPIYFDNNSKFSMRSLSSDRNKFHEKKMQKQNNIPDNFDESKTTKYSGNVPPSRDSSIESRTSVFLPKFASRTSLQNISDNETGK